VKSLGIWEQDVTLYTCGYLQTRMDVVKPWEVIFADLFRLAWERDKAMSCTSDYSFCFCRERGGTGIWNTSMHKVWRAWRSLLKAASIVFPRPLTVKQGMYKC